MKYIFIALLFILYSCGGGGGSSHQVKPVSCSLDNTTKKIEGAFVLYPLNLRNYHYKYIVLTPYDINQWIDNQTRENFLIDHLNKYSYIGINMGGNDWWDKRKFENQDFINRQYDLIDKIYADFGNDIAGIYIPQEADLCNYSPSLTNYFSKITKYAHQYNYKTLIAPYWSHCSLGDFEYAVNGIKNASDYVAIQDGVSVRKIKDLNYLKPYLKIFHCILGKKAWIDLECFNSIQDMTTTIYQDKKLYNRVQSQIKVDEKYCSHILGYDNLNLRNGN